MNLNVTVPCKDCDDREAGCHGRCERYAAFRVEIETGKEEERREHEAAAYAKIRSLSYRSRVVKDKLRGRGK